MQLMGRLTGWAPGAKGGRRPGEVEESPPQVETPPRVKPPPLIPDPETPRKRGELCPLEAMLLEVRGPESWLMDCSLPSADWELPPPPGEAMEGELGSLEEVDAAFAEPSPTASSLGSWADECERADAALAAAEAQLGRGCPEESREGGLTLTGDLLEEEDGEWLLALKAALAPPPPRLEGTGGPPPGRQGAPKPIQGPPPAKGDQRKTRPAPGKGAMASKAGETAAQGAAAGKKLRRPTSLRDPDEDEIQVVKVQQGGLTLPTRVKERPYERDDQHREWQGRGGWSSRS